MVAGMSAECLTYKTVARLLGSLLRELSVGLREFFAKKHLADKHNFDLINGRLRRRRIFTVSTVILSGRTQFAPNDVQFPLQFCLRDAEDVVPYDRIAVDSLYIQQNFDLNSYRTIPPSRLTPCHLPLHKGGEGKCNLSATSLLLICKYSRGMPRTSSPTILLKPFWCIISNILIFESTLQSSVTP